MVSAGFGAFFSPEDKRSPKKKRSSPDLERILVPKMTQDDRGATWNKSGKILNYSGT